MASSIRTGTSQLVLQARDEPRDDAPAEARRLPQARQAGRRRACPAFLHPLPPNAPPTRLTFASWLVDREVADDGARDRQPRLAGVLRHRPRRAPARTSARRARRRRIPSCSTGWPSSSWSSGWSLKQLHRLIVTSATYRQSSRVDARAARERSVQPAARPRRRASASKARSCATSRWRPAACSTRRSAARASSARAGVPVPAAGQLRPEDLDRGDRRRPLPPRALHVPLPLDAVSRCSQTFDAPNGDVRLRAADALEHAAAGADDAERAARRWKPRGRLALRILDEGGQDRRRAADLRLPPLPSAARRRDREQQILLQLLEKQKARVAEGWINPHALATGKDELPDSCPTGVTPATARRLDRRRPRAAEPGRDDHQGITEARTDRWPTTSISINRSADAALPSRRWFFQRVRRRPRRDRAGTRCSASVRASAAAAPAGDPLAPKQPHFAPKAKSVIFLFMAGAPSHLELFDNKPRAREVRRQAAAGRAAQGLPRRVHQPELASCSGPKFKFAKHGQCGAELSELLPAPGRGRRRHRDRQVDGRPTRSTTRPAQIFMNTGSQQFGRPSMGAWTTYGLGSEVAGPAGLRRVQHRPEGPQRRQLRTGAAASCRPSTRACRSAAQGDPVLYLSNPPRRRRRAAARLARRHPQR